MLELQFSNLTGARPINSPPPLFCRDYRVNRGQCHHQPYLGTREFSAFFGVPESEDKPIERSDELGLMLLDVDFINDPTGSTIDYFTHDETGAKVTRGKAQPKFFRARLENGVLRVPES